MAETRIRLLPDDLSNQIAAGEVVERPASAAKELIENALDAGSRRVWVEAEDGGRKSLRIVDDGTGMNREDALLAIRRHATSKIRTAEDLRAIRSLGFRGEALPSIASVSRFRLVTRATDEPVGTTVVLHGGGEPLVSDSGGPAGTAVEVRDLFFNVPARLKFLRAAATEMGHLSHLVDCFALGYPQVHFRLVHNERIVSDYPAEAQLRARIYAVLGKDVSKRLFEVYLDGQVLTTGFVSEPTLSRPNPQQLYTFVNGRHVRDKLLYRAVLQAYGSLLERGRYPVGALFLTVPADEVDVNVHPTKSEVRFASSGAVFEAVSRAVRITLAAAPWAGQARPDVSAEGLADELGELPASPYPSTAPSSVIPAASEDGGAALSRRGGTSGAGRWTGFSGARRTAPAGLPAVQPELPLHLSFSLGSEASPPTAEQESLRHLHSGRAGALLGHELGETQAPGDADASAENGRGSCESEAYAAASTRADGAPADGIPGDGQFFRRLQYVGQVRRTYLVCQSRRGLVLIDQHAADERYHYERLRAVYRERGLAPQPLLFPELLEVDPSIVAVVEEHQEELLRMGLELVPMGPRSLALKAVPDLLLGKHYAATVHDVLAELAHSGAARALDDRIDLIFATMACHTAVRAGDSLSPEEARALLVRMDDTPFAANCPHGRPVLAVTPFTEIERWFHRT